MIAIGLAILGAIVGGLTARKRGGNRKDIAQYATGYGFAFLIVGMIATVLLDRMLSL